MLNNYILKDFYSQEQFQGLNFEEIVQLDDQQFSWPWKWDKQTWKKYLFSSRDMYISVIYDENTIVGFALFDLSVLDHLGHLYKIALKEGYKRQGLAGLLMQHCVSILQELKVSSIYLEVDTSNLSAIGLYTKLNFKELVRKKKFYRNGHDALAMELRL